jgi:hypothetical protein
VLIARFVRQRDETEPYKALLPANFGLSRVERPFRAEYLLEFNVGEDHDTKSMTFTGW